MGPQAALDGRALLSFGDPSGPAHCQKLYLRQRAAQSSLPSLLMSWPLPRGLGFVRAVQEDVSKVGSGARTQVAVRRGFATVYNREKERGHDCGRLKSAPESLVAFGKRFMRRRVQQAGISIKYGEVVVVKKPISGTARRRHQVALSPVDECSGLGVSGRVAWVFAVRRDPEEGDEVIRWRG